MNYIVEILIVIMIIAVWQVILFLLRKNYNTGKRDGEIEVTTHIFNQIKQNGKIDITLNGEKISVRELKKK